MDKEITNELHSVLDRLSLVPDPRLQTRVRIARRLLTALREEEGEEPKLFDITDGAWGGGLIEAYSMTEAIEKWREYHANVQREWMADEKPEYWEDDEKWPPAESELSWPDFPLKIEVSGNVILK